MRPVPTLRRWLGLAAVLAALLAAAGPAQAEVEGKSWDFSLHFGGIFLSRDIGDDNLVVALRGGYSFSPWIEIEGSWVAVSTNSVEADDLNSDMDVYSLDLLYHFLPDGHAVPYVLLGAGLIQVDLETGPDESLRNTGFFWEGGGGVKIPLNESLAVRFDLRFQRFRTERDVPAPAPLTSTLSDDRFTNRMFTIGIGYHFPVGERMEAAVPMAPLAPLPEPPPPPPRPAPKLPEEPAVKTPEPAPPQEAPEAPPGEAPGEEPSEEPAPPEPAPPQEAPEAPSGEAPEEEPEEPLPDPFSKRAPVGSSQPRGGSRVV
ncbi:MAG: porin family protein [Acidobacteriota bacterium]